MYFEWLYFVAVPSACLGFSLAVVCWCWWNCSRHSRRPATREKAVNSDTVTPPAGPSHSLSGVPPVLLTSEQFSDLIRLLTERRQARANGSEVPDSQDNDEVKMSSTDAGSSTASLRQHQRHRSGNLVTLVAIS